MEVQFDEVKYSYNVRAYKIIENTNLSSFSNIFECELNIPDANYIQRKTALYEPGKKILFSVCAFFAVVYSVELKGAEGFKWYFIFYSSLGSMALRDSRSANGGVRNFEIGPNLITVFSLLGLFLQFTRRQNIIPICIFDP